jgi:hypothetical protein
VIDTNFAHLKRRAVANPNGPEALRLDWLLARVIGSPREHLLELIGRYRSRNFAIPEIDAFVDEQLACAREALEHAERTRALAPRKLRALGHTIESALAAERGRRAGCDNPLLVPALDAIGRLLETRSH